MKQVTDMAPSEKWWTRSLRKTPTRLLLKNQPESTRMVRRTVLKPPAGKAIRSRLTSFQEQTRTFDAVHAAPVNVALGVKFSRRHAKRVALTCRDMHARTPDANHLGNHVALDSLVFDRNDTA